MQEKPPGIPQILGLDPENLSHPSQLEVARLLESISIKEWIKGSEVAARYVVSLLGRTDPHLGAIFDRLAVLQADVAKLGTDEASPLVLVETERDLEHCLENWPENLHSWAFDLVVDWSNGQLEWKPEILRRLARGRLARGEGDAARLAEIAETAEWLIEQTRRCLEDDQKTLAWQRGHEQPHADGDADTSARRAPLMPRLYVRTRPAFQAAVQRAERGSTCMNLAHKENEFMNFSTIRTVALKLGLDIEQKTTFRQLLELFVEFLDALLESYKTFAELALPR